MLAVLNVLGSMLMLFSLTYSLPMLTSAIYGDGLLVDFVIAALIYFLLAAGEQRWDSAADLLSDLMPGLVRVGGSAAQREVVEETLLFALVSSGQAERALAVLDSRLDRRASPLDARRRGGLLAVSV